MALRRWSSRLGLPSRLRWDLLSSRGSALWLVILTGSTLPRCAATQCDKWWAYNVSSTSSGLDNTPGTCGRFWTFKLCVAMFLLLYQGFFHVWCAIGEIKGHSIGAAIDEQRDAFHRKQAGEDESSEDDDNAEQLLQSRAMVLQRIPPIVGTRATLWWVWRALTAPISPLHVDGVQFNALVGGSDWAARIIARLGQQVFLFAGGRLDGSVHTKIGRWMGVMLTVEVLCWVLFGLATGSGSDFIVRDWHWVVVLVAAMALFVCHVTLPIKYFDRLCNDRLRIAIVMGVCAAALSCAVEWANRNNVVAFDMQQPRSVLWLCVFMQLAYQCAALFLTMMNESCECLHRRHWPTALHFAEVAHAIICVLVIPLAIPGMVSGDWVAAAIMHSVGVGAQEDKYAADVDPRDVGAPVSFAIMAFLVLQIFVQIYTLFSFVLPFDPAGTFERVIRMSDVAVQSLPYQLCFVACSLIALVVQLGAHYPVHDLVSMARFIAQSLLFIAFSADLCLSWANIMYTLFAQNFYPRPIASPPAGNAPLLRAFCSFFLRCVAFSAELTMMVHAKPECPPSVQMVFEQQHAIGIALVSLRLPISFAYFVRYTMASNGYFCKLELIDDVSSWDEILPVPETRKWASSVCAVKPPRVYFKPLHEYSSKRSWDADKRPDRRSARLYFQGIHRCIDPEIPPTIPFVLDWRHRLDPSIPQSWRSQIDYKGQSHTRDDNLIWIMRASENMFCEVQMAFASAPKQADPSRSLLLENGEPVNAMIYGGKLNEIESFCFNEVIVGDPGRANLPGAPKRAPEDEANGPELCSADHDVMICSGTLDPQKSSHVMIPQMNEHNYSYSQTSHTVLNPWHFGLKFSATQHASAAESLSARVGLVLLGDWAQVMLVFFEFVAYFGSSKLITFFNAVMMQMAVICAILILLLAVRGSQRGVFLMDVRAYDVIMGAFIITLLDSGTHSFASLRTQGLSSAGSGWLKVHDCGSAEERQEEGRFGLQCVLLGLRILVDVVAVVLFLRDVPISSRNTCCRVFDPNFVFFLKGRGLGAVPWRLARGIFVTIPGIYLFAGDGENFDVGACWFGRTVTIINILMVLAWCFSFRTRIQMTKTAAGDFHGDGRYTIVMSDQHTGMHTRSKALVKHICNENDCAAETRAYTALGSIVARELMRDSVTYRSILEEVFVFFWRAFAQFGGSSGRFIMLLFAFYQVAVPLVDAFADGARNMTCWGGTPWIPQITPSPTPRLNFTAPMIPTNFTAAVNVSTILPNITAFSMSITATCSFANTTQVLPCRDARAVCMAYGAQWQKVFGVGCEFFVNFTLACCIVLWLIFRIVIAKIQVQVGHSPGHACCNQVWVISTAFGIYFAVAFAALWAQPVGGFLNCFLVQPLIWFFKTYGHVCVFFTTLSWSVGQLLRNNARVADEESAYSEDQQHASLDIILRDPRNDGYSEPAADLNVKPFFNKKGDKDGSSDVPVIGERLGIIAIALLRQFAILCVQSFTVVSLYFSWMYFVPESVRSDEWDTSLMMVFKVYRGTAMFLIGQHGMFTYRGVQASNDLDVCRLRPHRFLFLLLAFTGFMCLMALAYNGYCALQASRRHDTYSTNLLLFLWHTQGIVAPYLTLMFLPLMNSVSNISDTILALDIVALLICMMVALLLNACERPQSNAPEAIPYSFLRLRAQFFKDESGLPKWGLSFVHPPGKRLTWTPTMLVWQSRGSLVFVVTAVFLSGWATLAFSMRHRGIENSLGVGQDFELFDEYCALFIYFTGASTAVVLVVLLTLISVRYWSQCNAPSCHDCKSMCPDRCCTTKKACRCFCKTKASKDTTDAPVHRFRECMGSFPILQWFWAPIPYSFPRADFLKPGKGTDTVTSHIQVQESGGRSCWVSRQIIYERFWHAAELIDKPEKGDFKSGWVTFLLKRICRAKAEQFTISPYIFSDMVSVMQYRMSTRYLDAAGTALKFIRGTGNKDMGDQFQRKLFHQYDKVLMRWSQRIPPLGLADEAVWDMLGMTVVPDHGEGDFLRKLRLHIMSCLNMKMQWRHLASVETPSENVDERAAYKEGYITKEANWWFHKHCSDEGAFLKVFKGQLDSQAHSQTRKDPDYSALTLRSRFKRALYLANEFCECDEGLANRKIRWCGITARCKRLLMRLKLALSTPGWNITTHLLEHVWDCSKVALQAVLLMMKGPIVEYFVGVSIFSTIYLVYVLSRQVQQDRTWSRVKSGRVFFQWAIDVLRVVAVGHGALIGWRADEWLVATELLSCFIARLCQVTEVAGIEKTKWITSPLGRGVNAGRGKQSNNWKIDLDGQDSYEVPAAEVLEEKVNNIAIAGSARDGRAYRLFPTSANETKRSTLPILFVSAGARTRNYGPLIAVGFFAVILQLCVMVEGAVMDFHLVQNAASIACVTEPHTGHRLFSTLVRGFFPLEVIVQFFLWFELKNQFPTRPRRLNAVRVRNCCWLGCCASWPCCRPICIAYHSFFGNTLRLPWRISRHRPPAWRSLMSLMNNIVRVLVLWHSLRVTSVLHVQLCDGKQPALSSQLELGVPTELGATFAIFAAIFAIGFALDCWVWGGEALDSLLWRNCCNGRRVGIFWWPRQHHWTLYLCQSAFLWLALPAACTLACRIEAGNMNRKALIAFTPWLTLPVMIWGWERLSTSKEHIFSAFDELQFLQCINVEGKDSNPDVFKSSSGEAKKSNSNMSSMLRSVVNHVTKRSTRGNYGGKKSEGGAGGAIVADEANKPLRKMLV